MKKRKPRKTTKNKKRRKKFAIALAVMIAAGLIFGTFFIALPGRKVYKNAKAVYAHVRPLKDSVYLQDLDMMKSELDAVEKDISLFKKSIKPFSWLKAVPIAAGYFNDLEHGLAAADESIVLSKTVLDAITPFADVLGFQQEGSPGAGDAGTKLEGLVQTMPALVSETDEIETRLKEINKHLEKINPNRYPKKLKSYQLRSLLANTQTWVAGMDKNIEDVQKFLILFPRVMGNEGEKNYLVLFQNDKELRPTGGFLTAYALVTVDVGTITDLKSDDMYHLDNRIQGAVPAPPVLRNYLKVEEWYARDANLSPDFKESAEKFESFWRRDPTTAAIDGVVGIDTYLVRDLLEVLGPVELSGYEEPFSSENVVYQLELYANLLGKETYDRKDLLGELMDAMMEKAFSAPPDRWQPMLNVALSSLKQKHILLYLHDVEAQQLAEKYGFAGRVKEFDGDYLHVNDANLAGAKANMYLQQSVMQDISIAKDGTVTKTVTVNLHNPEPADGWLNGTYYDWMRIYVPKGSKLLDADAWRQVSVDEDLGKTVFETYTFCKPQGSSSVTVSYKLPFKLDKKEDLEMLVQKQPGKDANQYEIKVDGKVVESFELVKDKEVVVGR